MAEDRMLSDEILLGLIKANSGGGGGGTSNYNDLSNKPQIGGVTLSGNKSASDLGLADDNTVQGILDGQTINSFGDVETALAAKQDALTFDNAPTENSNNPVKSGGVYSALAGKVNTENGKGLSTNDYSDTEKAQVATNTEDIGSLKSGLTTLDDEVNGDATTYPYADVITIEDAVPANLADCSVKIEPVQDLHGYDKPWVGGAGKNKLPYPYASADGTYSTVSITTDWDGTININGTPSGDIYYNLTGNDFVLPQGEYIVSVDNIPNNSRVVLGSTYLDMANKSRTITSDGTTPLNIYLIMNTNTGATNISMKPMIRLATETDATFAPYTNVCPISGHTEASVEVTDGDETTKTYTIALGDTIYGGTVDFDSGVMTVDKKYIEFNGGETENWTRTQDRPHSFCHTENLGIVDAWSSTDIKMISNQFIQNGEVAYYGSNYRIGYNATNELFFVGIPSIDNVADFKTYLSNNHLQVVGELATPTTIQLTPQQIQLLKGQNTLTASTGQISVTVNGISGAIGSVQEQVNGLAEEVAEIKPLNYSTTEQKTGQKWIDGKDIYFITLSTPIQISANDQWIDTGLNGIDSLIDYTIRLTREDEQVGSGFNSGYIDVVVRNNTLNVKGHNFTITDLYAISSMTVYYTKNA